MSESIVLSNNNAKIVQVLERVVKEKGSGINPLEYPVR